MRSYLRVFFVTPLAAVVFLCLSYALGCIDRAGARNVEVSRQFFFLPPAAS